MTCRSDETIAKVSYYEIKTSDKEGVSDTFRAHVRRDERELTYAQAGALLKQHMTGKDGDLALYEAHFQRRDDDYELGDRKCEILPGQKWRHFKGKIVTVLGVAKDTECPMQEYVVYRDDKNWQVWIRPLEMFLSVTDREKYPDAKQNYRFELLK